jgi:hypothetical protein
MDERRKTPRRKTFKAGMIITHEPFSTVNCVVRNVSAAGAGIQVESAVPLSGRFELLFDGKSLDCEVKWRSLFRLGVTFTPSNVCTAPPR